MENQFQSRFRSGCRYSCTWVLHEGHDIWVSLVFKRWHFVLLVFFSCCTRGRISDSSEKTLFSLVAPEYSQVHFNNQLTEGLNTNILMYEYFYNGGGVAAGDVNNDGLDDLYFTSNMTSNKLYLNRGQMKFEDVTVAAGVKGREGPWKTGVTMLDINGDRLLDLYVCYSGKVSGAKRVNQLFVNSGVDRNGIPIYHEEAASYNLADSSFTTHAAFFDYDRDGDLDALLLNHNPRRINNLTGKSIEVLLETPDPLVSLKLLRNDKNFFHDVTGLSRIKNTTLSYGLGIGVADINADGWMDVYVSNDYDAPDYLYINNGDGTFDDRLDERLTCTSHFSMGNNIVDVNNDALPDIFTLDMLPESNHRQKMLFGSDNYTSFDLKVRAGFHQQYMRNMFHLNNGDGTFSEIGQLSGISNTDWSWAPLFADFDNDGWKDLFVTNGFVRDFTNMDFVKFANERLGSAEVRRKDLLEIVRLMPSSEVVSCAFKNRGDLTFERSNAAWGINTPANSNGAAYSDLDNDGDLDLVVSNINKPAFIYRNGSNSRKENHFLKIKLDGLGMNTQGVGAKVTLFAKGGVQYLEQMPARGYQSSVSPTLHFGLGSEARIDSLRVEWLSGNRQLIVNPRADELLLVSEKNASMQSTDIHPSLALLRAIEPPLRFTHRQSNVNDFKRQPLMINAMSFAGPCMASGDVNGDGMQDVYVGGGDLQSGTLFIRQRAGGFAAEQLVDSDNVQGTYDTDAMFFDANQDGHVDLYVCKGGYHGFEERDVALQDRLYMNDGKGKLVGKPGFLPAMLTSSSCVRASDINGDGYPDLFVGGRVIPGRYPEAPSSYVLVNNGHGQFIDMTSIVGKALSKIGMVTDAAWIDLDGDEKKDLVVVGEWMPITVFLNINGILVNKTGDYFDKAYSGWWNKLHVKDLNNDGRDDLVVGNFGTNTQCKVSDQQPADLYFKDFDRNGSVDPMLCFYVGEKSYPCLSRDELIDQLGMMRAKFPNYARYADATIDSVFDQKDLGDANHLSVNFLETACFLRDVGGRFHLSKLPVQAQFSPVHAIVSSDFDADGNIDLLLCGNADHARLRLGNNRANHGTLLKGDGHGHFTYVSQSESGLKIKGDVRSVIEINNLVLVGINQSSVHAFRLRGKQKLSAVRKTAADVSLHRE